MSVPWFMMDNSKVRCLKCNTRGVQAHGAVSEGGSRRYSPSPPPPNWLQMRDPAWAPFFFTSRRNWMHLGNFMRRALRFACRSNKEEKKKKKNIGPPLPCSIYKYLNRAATSIYKPSFIGSFIMGQEFKRKKMKLRC